MIRAHKLQRLAWIAAMIAAAVFVLFLLSDSGFDEVLLHLFGGFALFLRDNLSKVSTDSGTWAPGLLAFCLALLIAHRFLSQYAIKRDRSWSFVSSVCLGLLLPILFIIAFIVPGALLQVKSLAENPWFQDVSATFPETRLSLRNVGVWIDKVFDDKHSTRSE